MDQGPVIRRHTRDRRGRGARGPAVLPTDPRFPVLRTRRDRFDDLVLGIVSEVDDRWQERLGIVEYAVEDAPHIPADWSLTSRSDWSQSGSGGLVPLSSLVRGTGDTPTRLVLFRRPIEHRCETRSELEALVLTVVVEQVAELLGLDAGEVDPRYEDRDDPDDPDD